jgi:hypothetical protein
LTQPSHPPSQVVPLLIAALVCDVAVPDPSTGKHNLIGIFDRINVGRFPAGRRMSVYIKLTDAEGHYDLEINFVQIATGNVLAGAKGTLDVPNRLASVDTSIAFPKLALPAAGRYEFQVRANSVFLGSTFLDATQAPKLQ